MSLCPGAAPPCALLCLGMGDRQGRPLRAHPKGPVSAATQIITKEIEANEWKKKYEESRQEVLEMR